jgi:DNA-binding CsgD family transcriptional regulator
LLRHRLATQADFFSLHGEIAPRYGSDAFVHSKLPEFWSAMLGSPAAVPLIVEDFSGREPRVAASRLFAAVKEPFAEELLAGKVRPPVAAEVVRRWLDGRSPVLTPVEVKLANKGAGLRLLTVHVWEAVPKEMPRLYCDVCASQVAGMNQFLKGAKIAELIEDAYTQYDTEVNETIGYRYRAKFDCGAWVGSITKADAEKDWQLYVAGVFQYRPPRLDLSETHREILALALEGMTDEEIAAALFLSTSAVKKRWSAIYDHVSSRGIASEMPQCEGKRGPERRRGLLDYLRWHPEELNPIALH